MWEKQNKSKNKKALMTLQAAADHPGARLRVALRLGSGDERAAGFVSDSFVSAAWVSLTRLIVVLSCFQSSELFLVAKVPD